MLKLKLVCCFALIGKIDTIFQCPISTKEYIRVLEKLETIDERCGEWGRGCQPDKDYHPSSARC